MALQHSSLEESNAVQMCSMNSQVQNVTDAIVLERNAIEVTVYAEFEKVTTARDEQVLGFQSKSTSFLTSFTIRSMNSNTQQITMN